MIDCDVQSNKLDAGDMSLDVGLSVSHVPRQMRQDRAHSEPSHLRWLSPSHSASIVARWRQAEHKKAQAFDKKTCPDRDAL